MTAILRNASGKMHHGILFDRRLGAIKGVSPGSTAPSLPRPPLGSLRSPLFLLFVNQKPNKQTSHE